MVSLAQPGKVFDLEILHQSVKHINCEKKYPSADARIWDHKAHWCHHQNPAEALFDYLHASDHWKHCKERIPARTRIKFVFIQNNFTTVVAVSGQPLYGD